MTDRTIAVTGSTGFVGRHVVSELVTRGHNVRCLARDPGKAREALGPIDRIAEQRGVSLTAIQGDITDPGSLDTLLESATDCVHLVGIIREDKGNAQTFERVHVRGTQNVVEACERAGFRDREGARYLHMSAMGVGPEGRAPYQRTKFEAEQYVRRSGLAWTIFRPGVIHGEGGELVEMLAGILRGETAPYFFAPYFARGVGDPLSGLKWEPALVAPVSVCDVAAAFGAALETDDAVGEIYNLAGPQTLDWQRMLEVMRDRLPDTKKSMGTWHVPAEHAAAIAGIAELLGLSSMLPFDRGQALMGAQDTTADTTKARKQLGFDPAPFDRVLAGYANNV